jgi:hypothetical protein
LAHLFHTERSVAELAVFLPGKGERAPAAFVERGGNLNRGVRRPRTPPPHPPRPLRANARLSVSALLVRAS